MPIGVTIELDLEPLFETLKQLGTSVEARVLSAAVNRAARDARVTLRRSVQDVVSLRAKDVNAVLSVHRASRRDLQAVIAVASKPIPLIRYGARETSRGVTVRVKKGGGRKVVRVDDRGAFLATVGSGHRGVFVRRSKQRLPIRELFGPSVAQVVKDASLEARLQEAAAETFLREVERGVTRALAKAA